MTIPIVGERRSGKAAVIVARDTLSVVTSKLYKPFAPFVTFHALRGPLPFSSGFPGSPPPRNSLHRKPNLPTG
jgi:hypothetical protein